MTTILFDEKNRYPYKSYAGYKINKMSELTDIFDIDL